MRAGGLGGGRGRNKGCCRGQLGFLSPCVRSVAGVWLDDLIRGAALICMPGLDAPRAGAPLRMMAAPSQHLRTRDGGMNFLGGFGGPADPPFSLSLSLHQSPLPLLAATPQPDRLFRAPTRARAPACCTSDCCTVWVLCGDLFFCKALLLTMVHHRQGSPAQHSAERRPAVGPEHDDKHGSARRRSNGF